MRVRRLPGTLGDEVIAMIAPGESALRFEVVRCLEKTRMMIGAVKIEQHPVILINGMATPLEGFGGQAANDGKEGIKPPHLFGEEIIVLIPRAFQLLDNLG